MDCASVTRCKIPCGLTNLTITNTVHTVTFISWILSCLAGTGTCKKKKQKNRAIRIGFDYYYGYDICVSKF